jgi:hypothetical protein
MVAPTYLEHAGRIILTLVLFVALGIQTLNPFVLVGLLIVLDAIGSLYATGDAQEKERVYASEEYQQADKVSDALTYLMLLYFLPNDPVLSFFVVYRALGVLVYVLTQRVWPVIVFFDFVKEYILFRALFAHEAYANVVLAGSVFLKVLFELYFHTIHNRHAELTMSSV